MQYGEKEKCKKYLTSVKYGKYFQENVEEKSMIKRLKNDDADQGFAGGIILAAGIAITSNGWIWLGIVISVLGALIYLEKKFTILHKEKTNVQK